LKLSHAVERFREYRQVWCADSNDLSNSFTKMKETLEYIDIIKVSGLKRIKKAIPPIFNKVSRMIEDFEVTEERMKMSGELFKKYNDLIEKTAKITEVH
jgi:hypothetical protein